MVAVSRVSGREIDFAKDAYGIMKAALVHYTSGLAFQHAAAGVRANSVSPGNTYFHGGVWQTIETANPELFDTALGLNPTGRMATAEEVAYGVVMLASPRPVHHRYPPGVDGALTRGVQLQFAISGSRSLRPTSTVCGNGSPGPGGRTRRRWAAGPRASRWSTRRSCAGTGRGATTGVAASPR